MATFRTLMAATAVAGLGLGFAPAISAPDAPSVAAGSDFAPQLVTVDAPTLEDRNRVVSLGLDVTEHAGHDYVEVVLHSADDAAALAAAGFDWDVRIADLVAREAERRELDAEFAALNPVTDLPSGRNGYRTLADFDTEIDTLVEDYATAGPDGTPLAKRISLGESVEGRDLSGIEIGVGVTEPEDGRPVLLMFGAHHAREWPSAEAPMEFAHTLLRGWNGELEDHGVAQSRVRDLLSRARVVIVPVSNPDGFLASRESGDIIDFTDPTFDPITSVPDSQLGEGTTTILATPGNAYKRKNCRYVDGQTQPAGTCTLVASPGGLGAGIDLNRNYGALWGGPGADAEPYSAIYHGPAPFSEPETQAIRSLISTRQVTTLISNHTFSNLLLRPVGLQPSTIHPDGNPVGFAPDECFTTAEGIDYGMQSLGEAMTAQTGYSNQFGWELYDTTGTTEDYSYNATGGYGYTFEIGPDEFHPPYENVVNEYTGETDAATGVAEADDPHAAAEALTTPTADDCSGHDHEPQTYGGGLQEAYLLALENAADAATHSVITGTAPAGATLTLERSGVFPTWDGTLVGDVVATSMVVGDDGQVEWHVNPSTRPFVQSRKADVLTDPIDELTTSGQSLPTQTTTHEFQVNEAADLLSATVRTTVPVDLVALVYGQFYLDLIDPGGNVVATADEFGPVNSIAFTGIDGEGVNAGDIYTLRVRNTLGLTARYDLEATTQRVVAPQTPRQFETWTLTCTTSEGIAGQAPVLVERGEQVDLGEVCGRDVEEEDRPDRRGPPTDRPGRGKGRPPAGG